SSSFFFFFYYTATTVIYTLSLHDALPIFTRQLILSVDLPVVIHRLQHHDLRVGVIFAFPAELVFVLGEFLNDLLYRYGRRLVREDRKSTRLNSSHDQISYAVFCLKKKKKS